MGIPTPVWRLIKRVTLHPRTHPFTVSSFSTAFSNALACTRPLMFTDNKAAAIFKHAPNVPGASALASGRLSFLYVKYLVAAALFIVCGYLFALLIRPIISADHYAQAVLIYPPITPEDIASFLSQPPKVQKEMLAVISVDIPRRTAYQKAQQKQEEIFSQLYLRQENQLISQQTGAQELFSSLTDIRVSLITLKEALKKENKLTLSAERSLISMMSELNNAQASSPLVAQNINRNEEALARLIIQGKTQAVDDVLDAKWADHQANAYFYTQVITKRLINRVIALSSRNEKIQDYSRSIKNIKTAMLYLGDIPLLSEKIRDLILARSEYILFSTLTEKVHFAPEKLHLALDELNQYSPDKYKKITETLIRISKNAIEQSYKKTKTATGALTVMRALKDHKVKNEKASRDIKKEEQEKKEEKGASA